MPGASCQEFFPWYNKEHKHSALGFLTPEQAHYGLAEEILKNRASVLKSAFKEHPNRFKGKMPKPLSLPEAAWINPPQYLMKRHEDSLVQMEDTLEARRLIRRILQSQGNFTILKAEDGREGLELVQRELPDLVILDLMMPEMDGFSVIEALRASPETATIPVIVATAKELTPDEKNRLSGHI